MTEPQVAPIRKMMRRRGWSILRTAGISNVSGAVVRHIERWVDGNAETQRRVMNMTIRSVCKVALALECAPSDLLPFLGSRPTKKAYETTTQSKAMKEAARVRALHATYQENNPGRNQYTCPHYCWNGEPCFRERGHEGKCTPKDQT